MSNLLLCNAFGHSAALRKSIILVTHQKMFIDKPICAGNPPGSTLNFSMSLKTCLVRIFGWICARFCLDRVRPGNSLQRHTCTLLDFIAYYNTDVNPSSVPKLVFTHSRGISYLLILSALKLGWHQESSSETSCCSSCLRPLTNASANDSLSSTMRGTHICGWKD